MAENFSIVPANLAVRALRDSGYKDTAHAIAELVDNAVQAKAKTIEILCVEEEVFINTRTRSRVKAVAVIDDGYGMDKAQLRAALQFGNGANKNDQHGIGRFGMGLPNSSISQARKLEVWTWQTNCNDAIYSYLDLDEIETGDLEEVPSPKKKTVPKEWLNRSETARESSSGTIVLWSDLDRCDWRTAKAIFTNSEFMLGRTYRRFIDKDKLRIRMAEFFQKEFEPKEDNNIRSNNPLYLEPNLTVPAPFDTEALFEMWGDGPKEISAKYKGKNHPILITCSIAKKQFREDVTQAGEKPYGKHAKNNIGVSIVRANREIELQTGWCVQYDPRERWWKVEVDFPPALDDVFGMTNNKQSCLALASFSTSEADLCQIAEREGFESEQELQEAWEEDNDPRLILIQVKLFIESNLVQLRKILKAQTQSRSSGKIRHPEEPDSAENIGTAVTRERQLEGHDGSSDQDETATEAERKERITTGLTDHGLDTADAKNIALNVIQSGRKFEFYQTHLETAEFFTVRPRGGVLLIGLNTGHPAFDNLVTLLEADTVDDDIDTLRERLRRSYKGLKLLLEAWARYEDELTDGQRKDRAKDARMDWGRVARRLLRGES